MGNESRQGLDMLQVHKQRTGTKSYIKAFAKHPVALVGLACASGILLGLSVFLTNSHLIQSMLVITLSVLNGLLNTAHFESNKDNESSIPKFGERIFLLLLPKRQSECMLGDLSEEYVAKSAKFGARRARIWFYTQLLTSIYPLLLHSLKVIVSAYRFRVLTNPNRKDA